LDFANLQTPEGLGKLKTLNGGGTMKSPISKCLSKRKKTPVFTKANTAGEGKSEGLTRGGFALIATGKK